MSIKSLDLAVGKAVILDNEKLLISHYSADGGLITLHTDRGDRSFLNSDINNVLQRMERLQKPAERKPDLLGLNPISESSIPTKSASNMESTVDYSMFSRIDSNRKVDLKHVKNLMGAISRNNLLHLNPIIVNQQMKVVDGQHRLEAARRLEIPVYYIRDHRVNKQDIASLNSTKKNWSLVDYINFHTKENKSGFMELQQFMELYPGLSVSSALVLVSETGKRDTASIRTGIVDISNMDQAEEIAEFLVWLSQYYELAYTDGVVGVIRKFFNTEGFDVNMFKQKIEGQPRSLVKCINRTQYQEMFLQIYNWKASVNRLVM